MMGETLNERKIKGKTEKQKNKKKIASHKAPMKKNRQQVWAELSQAQPKLLAEKQNTSKWFKLAP